jgi:lysozyme
MGQRVRSTANRRINDEGLALIKQWEGLRLQAYRDPIGIWTIGYGHTLTAREGLTIAPSRAEDLLKMDLRGAEKIVATHVSVPLSDEEFSALVSFVFNVGPGKPGVKDGFVWLKNGKPSTMLRLLNAGDYEGALGEFSKWVNAGGKRLTGLVNRRAAEAGLFVRGSFVANQYVEPEAPRSDRSVSNRSDGQGVITATVGVGGTAIAVAAQQIGTIKDELGSVGPWLFMALTLAGLGYTLYSITRRKKE